MQGPSQGFEATPHAGRVLGHIHALRSDSPYSWKGRYVRAARRYVERRHVATAEGLKAANFQRRGTEYRDLFGRLVVVEGTMTSRVPHAARLGGGIDSEYHSRTTRALMIYFVYCTNLAFIVQCPAICF